MAGLPVLARMAWEHDPPLAALALAGIALASRACGSSRARRALDLAVVLAYAARRTRERSRSIRTSSTGSSCR
jgi:hypothetical protein